MCFVLNCLGSCLLGTWLSHAGLNTQATQTTTSTRPQRNFALPYSSQPSAPAGQQPVLVRVLLANIDASQLISALSSAGARSPGGSYVSMHKSDAGQSPMRKIVLISIEGHSIKHGGMLVMNDPTQKATRAAATLSQTPHPFCKEDVHSLDSRRACVDVYKAVRNNTESMRCAE